MEWSREEKIEDLKSLFGKGKVLVSGLVILFLFGGVGLGG